MTATDIAHLPKAAAEDFEGRFREILADPSNQYIPRCADAGKMLDGLVTLHNGLRVTPDYYDSFSRIFELNKGVHEPQEERMFMEVLKYMRPGATMVELGAYWAFYSMWFQQQVRHARNYMIEPMQKNLDIGVNNFNLNRMGGRFTLGGIGHEGMNFLEYMQQQYITYIDLLHMDIQGAELYFLYTFDVLFTSKRVAYVFISTHSQQLHLDCIAYLEARDYRILASADFDHETYCYDGIIVARDNQLAGLEPIQLDVRSRAACNA